MTISAKLSHVSKSYPKGKVALDDISLDMQEGEIIGLLGPNGSGKTTLIKIMNGLIRDYEGNIEVDGLSLGVHSKEVISYLPDEPYFELSQKGTDVLETFIDFYKDFDYAKCKRMLDKFQIDPSMKFKAMSKGMKEKFLLALVMARNAKILILDEPIAGVDPAARELILDTILENYNENQTIIIATHLIADLERMFSRVIFLKDGKVMLDREVDELRDDNNSSIDELFRKEFKC